LGLVLREEFLILRQKVLEERLDQSVINMDGIIQVTFDLLGHRSIHTQGTNHLAVILIVHAFLESVLHLRNIKNDRVILIMAEQLPFA